jgi:single-strand DNA-binding protein
MEHINRIEIQGMVGNVRTNEYNGTKVANFSVATDILYKTRDGAASETTWHNVVAWEGRGIPNLLPLEKGVLVDVHGRLRQVEYTGTDGVKKSFYEVVANRMSFPEEENHYD